MDVLYSSETLISTYKTIEYQRPQYGFGHLIERKNTYYEHFKAKPSEKIANDDVLKCVKGTGSDLF
jgi:hypothetical protein